MIKISKKGLASILDYAVNIEQELAADGYSRKEIAEKKKNFVKNLAEHL